MVSHDTVMMAGLAWSYRYHSKFRAFFNRGTRSRTQTPTNAEIAECPNQMFELNL